jgi:hypothetical protein
VENQKKFYKSYSELNESVDELFPIHTKKIEKDFILEVMEKEVQKEE